MNSGEPNPPFDCPIEKGYFRIEPHVIKDLREEITAAVSDGIVRGFTVLKEQATESTGRFVLGSLAGLLKKLFWAAVFMAAVYMVGGWSLVATTWKALVRP